MQSHHYRHYYDSMSETMEWKVVLNIKADNLTIIACIASEIKLLAIKI